MRVIRYDNVDNAGGAAGINSSVAEMAQWISSTRARNV
jgi:hypothetical protein